MRIDESSILIAFLYFILSRYCCVSSSNVQQVLNGHEQDAEGTDEKEELHEDQRIDDHLICSQ